MKPSRGLNEEYDATRTWEFTKFEVSLPVTILNGKKSIDGEVRKISIVSALIVVPKLPELDESLLDIAFKIPTHDYTVWATAEMTKFTVVESDDSTVFYGLNVRFVDISEEDLQFLSKTILH